MHLPFYSRKLHGSPSKSDKQQTEAETQFIYSRGSQKLDSSSYGLHMDNVHSHQSAFTDNTFASSYDDNLPLSYKLCIRSFIYEDIQSNIPFSYQNLISKVYYGWIIHSIINVCLFIGEMFMTNKNGLTCFYVLLVPITYVAWYRPAYYAFRYNSLVNLTIFFYIFSLQILVTLIQIFGVPNSRIMGFIAMFQTYKEHANISNFVIIGLELVIGAICGSILIMDLYLLFKVFKLYKFKLDPTSASNA